MSTCLLEHWQYVELNPLRARMVEQAQDWPWSSFRAHTSAAEAPACLEVAALARFNLEREPGSAADHAWAAQRYGEWVVQSPPEALWSDALRQQVYQGDEGFVQSMLARASERNQHSSDIPKPQRARPRSLAGRDPGSWGCATRGTYRIGPPHVRTGTRTRFFRWGESVN